MRDFKQQSDEEAMAELRRFALKKFRKNQELSPVGLGPMTAEETREIVEELRVHQIELEMQNEELRRRETELDTAKSRYFELFDLAPMGYVSLSAQGMIVEANLKVGSLLGMTRANLINQPFSRFLVREDQDQFYIGQKKLFATCVPDASEVRMLTKKGTEFCAHIENSLGLGSDGVAVARLALVDITNRRQVEEALETKSELLDVTLHSIADGVIATNAAGKVVLVNAVAEKLLSLSQAEALGKPLAEVFRIVQESSRLPRTNLAVRVMTTGKTTPVETDCILIAHNGTERRVEDSGAPIKNAAGAVQGVVVVFRDVTERQSMRQTLERGDKLRSLGILAGGLAHDFNNLLSGILGYISLARDVGSADAEVLEYLDKAESIHDRAKALTRQLLTFSTGGAPQKTTGGLGPLIHDITSFALSGSDLLADFAIDPQLHNCDFDPGQMGQVFDNLVINARQASPPGAAIRIEAANTVLRNRERNSLPAGSYLKISVIDKGCGIPKSVLKNIFDPFFTTKESGHGLGLATCQSIIEKHDGALEVRSEPGKGSTFTVYLPASTGPLPSEVRELAVSHRGSGTILVLDDEPFLREILREMLGPMGYEVIEASTEAQALALCSRGQKITAAIVDLTVPGGLGGLDLLTKLRTQLPKLPVFASSGYFQDPIMARPQEFGYTDSLGKPYRKSELAGMLEKHLARNEGVLP